MVHLENPPSKFTLLAVRTAIDHATDFVHPLKPVVLVRISTVCVCVVVVGRVR